MERLHPSDIWQHVLRGARSDEVNGWRILVAGDPTSTNCVAVALIHSETRDQSSERHIPYLTFFHEGIEALPCRCADINRYIYNGVSSNGSHRSRIKLLQAREQALQKADNQALTAARRLKDAELPGTNIIWDNYQSIWYDVLRKLLRPDQWLATVSPSLILDPTYWAHDIFVDLVLSTSGALTPIPQWQWSLRKAYDGFDDFGVAEFAGAYCGPTSTSQPALQVNMEVSSQADDEEGCTTSSPDPSMRQSRTQKWDNTKRMDAYLALNRLDYIASAVRNECEKHRDRRRELVR
ncbi:hypothetical protein PFICI_06147 [Pestalotiopsis fici W106-1]|uniref:Uncharacterized protein n=1 Tax=Pestalotiopsis fici (strain W106-1 / CGMCC3.15140) TaxID=1229662 RepID=W3X511_PESFW|nr:uncharacterized protein PFICI_06147 [Pestalotiopsis fici W106-1]ETS81145.1 hypothetical protein PFICI_06147 [Pestalotiopsis fici W106-1]